MEITNQVCTWQSLAYTTENLTLSFIYAWMVSKIITVKTKLQQFKSLPWLWPDWECHMDLQSTVTAHCQCKIFMWRVFKLQWWIFHLFYHNLQSVSKQLLGEYSYSLPGSVVTYNNSSNSYSAQGLTFTPIEERLKWRITYTGPLRWACHLRSLKVISRFSVTSAGGNSEYFLCLGSSLDMKRIVNTLYKTYVK